MNDYIPQIVSLALKEDIGNGDITTEAIYPGEKNTEAHFIAKQSGIIAGMDIVKYVFQQINPDVSVTAFSREGDRIPNGQHIGTLEGPAGSILTGERTALNFLQRMSGIATRTREYVDIISGTEAKILDTRKTVPGHRATDKIAVHTGGGVNHRIGLYDQYLIKENHINVAGGVTEAIDRCVTHRQATGGNSLIEVEVRNMNEVQEAAAHDAVDLLLLDNMSFDDMAKVVRFVDGSKKLEASGNVNRQTVRSIAETGVDFISVGELTHSVAALDISLLFPE